MLNWSLYLSLVGMTTNKKYQDKKIYYHVEKKIKLNFLNLNKK